MSNFILKQAGQTASLGGSTFGIQTNGEYIFVAITSALKVFSYDTVAREFTEENSYSSPSGYCRCLFYYNGYLYLGTTGGVYMYRVDNNALTLIDSWSESHGGTPLKLFVRKYNGETFVHVADAGAGAVALKADISAGTLTEIDDYSIAGTAYFIDGFDSGSAIILGENPGVRILAWDGTTYSLVDVDTTWEQPVLQRDNQYIFTRLPAGGIQTIVLTGTPDLIPLGSTFEAGGGQNVLSVNKFSEDRFRLYYFDNFPASPTTLKVIEFANESQFIPVAEVSYTSTQLSRILITDDIIFTGDFNAVITAFHLILDPNSFDTVLDTREGDIRLFPDPIVEETDVRISDRDLVRDSGIETAVMISLFTNRLADEEDLLPDSEGDRQGWWADAVNEDDDKIGSRLWLLQRSKTVQEIPSEAEGYIKEALQWMLDDGVASEIEVSVSRLDYQTLQMNIDITSGTGEQFFFKYVFNWKEQLARRVS